MAWLTHSIAHTKHDVRAKQKHIFKKSDFFAKNISEITEKWDKSENWVSWAIFFKKKLSFSLLSAKQIFEAILLCTKQSL